MPPEGGAWIQYDPNNKDIMAVPIAIQDFSGAGASSWELRNQIAWIRSATVPQRDGTEESFGSFRPLNSPDKLSNNWGVVYHLTRSRAALDKLALGVPLKDKSNLKRFGHEQDLRCRGNVWMVPNVTNASKRHPCPFPPKLAENCLRLQGLKPGDWVLDPFAGLGNTAVAAQKLGLNCILAEISPVYAGIIREDFVCESF